MLITTEQYEEYSIAQYRINAGNTRQGMKIGPQVSQTPSEDTTHNLE